MLIAHCGSLYSVPRYRRKPTKVNSNIKEVNAKIYFSGNLAADCERISVCPLPATTRKKVRRERMGHITLAVPIVHIWYLRSIPSKLSYLAGRSTKELERVIYYEMYMVLEPAASGLKAFDLIEEDEYLDYEEKYGYSAVSEEKRENDEYFYAAIAGADEVIWMYLSGAIGVIVGGICFRIVLWAGKGKKVLR